MKADKYGTPSEQARHEAGWRRAEAGEIRCDCCQYSHVIPNGNGKQTVRCEHVATIAGGVATQATATCNRAQAVPQPAPQSMRDMLVHGDMGPKWWAALEDASEVTLSSALAKLGPDSGERRHAIASKLGELVKARADQAVAKAGREQEAALRADPSISNNWRTFAEPDSPACSSCAHWASRQRNTNKCALTGFVTTPESTCNKHTPNEPMSTEDHMTERDDLPTVGEMMEATTPVPDKALPALKQASTDVVPYDQRRVVAECRFYMSQSAEALLEAGKRLIELKDNEPHGELQRIIESDLGIPYRTAARMMATALKFQSPALAPKVPALAGLGKTKLFELMTESDDDLAELADGGTLAGKTLDEIDRMTTRELKAALRTAKEDARKRDEELKADLAAKDKRIAKKDERINELEDRLEKKQAEADPVPDPLAEAGRYADNLRADTAKLVAEISAGIRSRCVAVLDAHQGDIRAHGELLVSQALGQIISAARTVGFALEMNIAPDAASALQQATHRPGQQAFDLLNAELDAEGE